MTTEYIDLLFEVPPGPNSTFIEAHDAAGKGINAGEWIENADGTWTLRIKRADDKLLADSCKLNEVVFRLAEKLGLVTPEQSETRVEIDDVVNRVMETIDEADRRAGSAERRCAQLSESVASTNRWLETAKVRAGAHRNTSFDLVYDGLIATETEVCAMNKDFADLFAFYEVTSVRQLIEAQVAHVQKLQAKLPPSRDAFPGSPRQG